MRNSILMKKALILLCAAMSLALFACDPGDTETDATENGTENPTVSEFGTEPEETEPGVTDPTESQPAESDPAESKPAESDPAESKPAESKPEESDPAESKPAESDPEDEKAEIEADVDYYLAFDYKNTGEIHYFEGKSDGVYPSSSNSEDGAVKVRLEAVTGGYYLYFIKNAVKNYVNVTKEASFISLEFGSEAKTVYTYDETLQTLTVSCDGKNYFIGAYGDYTFFSLSEVGYAKDSYVSYFIATECEHSYVGSDGGHTLLACAKCGLSAGALQPHGESVVEREDGRKTTYCKECGYILKIELCDGFHWLSDKDGHWEGACDICGTPENTDKKAHSEVLSEFVTDTTYSMGCDVCKYAFYSKDISSVAHLITARQWGIKATTYYQLNNGKSYGWFYYEEGDVPYGRITGSDKVGQILYNRNRNDASGASEAEQYTMDVGDSRYLIIKIRTNDNTQHMSLAFSTTGKNGVMGENGISGGTKNLTLPLSMLTNDEWGVIAIDLAGTFGEYYTKDAESGTYLVDSFFITMNDFESTTNIDIAYMAFTEGALKDIRSFVDEDKVLLVSGSSTVEVDLASGACTGDHAYNTEIIDGYYVGVCPACGDQKDYGVKAEDVKYFISPDYIKGNSSLQGTCDFTLKSENGVQFVRVDNFVPAGTTQKWGGFNLGNPNGSETGQYMIMKVRIGNNELAQSHLSMFIRSTGSGLVAGMGVSVKVSEDNEWHVIVVDLSTRIQDAATYFGTDSDGKYRARYIQIRPFSNNQVGAQADDYMDIAYIAFCDELDDVSSIVSDDLYELSKSRSESELRKTADHSCAVHSPSSVQTSAVEGGTKYSAICSVCSQVCYEITVPASVSKFYTGKDFATSATTYYNAGKGSVEYDSDNNIVFGRESGNLQMLWHRAQNDLRYNTRSNQTTTMDVGDARFFVIRVRTSNTARTLKLNYSTTAKNSDTAVATEDFTGTSYDITGKSGVKAGDTYCTNAGYTTFTFPMASLTAGEWTTFVIDLNAVAGEYHGKVDGAESYVVDTFYFDENDQTGNLDVEYMAFVEGDWSDVAELVGAGEVINITDKSGAFEEKTFS